MSDNPLLTDEPVTYSFTNITAYDFREAIENAEDSREKGELLETLRRMDSGRFHEMLDSTHKALSYADLKHKEALAENLSPWLLRWLWVFGALEDLTRHEVYVEWD
jgi:hypothetical protein